MESVAISGKARESGLSLRATEFYDESGAPLVQLDADFPSIGSKAGIPSFSIVLLGMVYRNGDTLATRFSDTDEAGCLFEQYADPRTLLSKACGDSIPNHYETRVHLTPGEYDLHFVLSYDGQLHRLYVPVSVKAYDDKHLSASGIALCRRFHQHWEPTQTPTVPTMPVELAPLVSKGTEFTPTGDARFKKKEPLTAYFELYEPLLTSTGAVNVQFQMKITDVNTGELKTDTGLRTADSFIRPGSRVIPIAEQIAIGELPPGAYRLEVQGSDSAGIHSEWQTTSFMVE